MDEQNETNAGESTGAVGSRQVGGDIQKAMDSGRGDAASDLQRAPEPPVRDPAAEPPDRSADDGDTGAPAG
jgi:hypothetical protein